ncbi:MAG: site-specific DNA-methyltransferase, partial [Candidatus Poribacteria bacterium]|nr:site-specific DNA-methyltransferase [Candidatus Poribacteria bacterium]
MKTASVDLIYLDPPFNSNRNYNLLYEKATGVEVPEQEVAFFDTWEITPENEELIRKFPEELKRYKDIDSDFLGFWNLWIGALSSTRPKLLAYLVYMTYRLLEMRRVLKPTGSIYLHCDSNASHYIKVMMDAIFGHGNFRNEIVWHYTGNSVPKRMFPAKHDTLLFYAKSEDTFFSPILVPYAASTIRRYNHVDSDGRRYKVSALKDGKQEIVYMKEGKMADSVWNIPIVRKKKERLGYPTQKPIELVERIINASSKEDEVVFDPFCGCGTAIYAAHLNNRQWIGCDIAILAVRLVR